VTSGWACPRAQTATPAGSQVLLPSASQTRHPRPRTRATGNRPYVGMRTRSTLDDLAVGEPPGRRCFHALSPSLHGQNELRKNYQIAPEIQRNSPC
jgi:hypothetical protein